MYVCMYVFLAFIIFTNRSVNIFNTPSSFYISHNNSLRWIGLRKTDLPKITQLVFLAKVGLELPVSHFLALV